MEHLLNRSRGSVDAFVVLFRSNLDKQFDSNLKHLRRFGD